MPPGQYHAAPSSPPANRSKRILIIATITLLIILLGAAVAGLVMQQKQLKEARQQAQRLEARLATLEAEDNFVESEIAKDRYQAVFLTNEQVYFAKITKVTKDTMKIEDIFYLNQGSAGSPGSNATSGSVSLAKLGQELHSPEDAMILERKNITFWENLKSDGQVAKAITEYNKSR